MLTRHLRRGLTVAVIAAGLGFFSTPGAQAAPSHPAAAVAIGKHMAPLAQEARHKRWHRPRGHYWRHGKWWRYGYVPRRICTTTWRHGHRIRRCWWR